MGLGISPKPTYNETVPRLFLTRVSRNQNFARMCKVSSLSVLDRTEDSTYRREHVAGIMVGALVFTLVGCGRDAADGSRDSVAAKESAAGQDAAGTGETASGEILETGADEPEQPEPETNMRSESEAGEAERPETESGAAEQEEADSESGTSEQYLERALRDYAKREETIVATKFLPRKAGHINRWITCVNKAVES